MIGGAIKENKAVAPFCKNHPLDADYSTVVLKVNKIY
jgi:hypothetical protein